MFSKIPQYVFRLAITYIWLFPQPSYSIELLDKNRPIEQGALDEVSGILIDRTVTFMGRDFYRHFSNFWRIEYPSRSEVLTIFERPSARWGSLIWIEYRSQKLIQVFLSPGRSKREETAKNHATIVADKLTKIRIAETFSDTFDVERDEI